MGEIEKGILKIKEAFPEEIGCHKQCSDCCFAVFDLSLVEAVYLNYRFFQEKGKEEQETILEKANTADRQAYRIKRNLNKMLTQGKQTEEEVLSLLSQERIECPLLNKNSLCDLYEYRPITCRVYGVPTAIHGAGHTCGISGFREGIAYPTINLDTINNRLIALSRDLLEEIQVKNPPLEQRWLPLSTSLLTDYDEDYFGL
ncbi:MAG: YkgJ family cysteine cluster protein [Deltaproteobacteria bacterium]|nr:YkgJ family cysteine cluster protein [Deltaproteobacteria bacterium]